MAIEIKVLTLNVWGIPGISKNRKARIEAISSQLASGPDLYDFVFLQELWSKDDYRFIADKVSRVLPYSHPFYSGVLGSGIVVFSKAPFTDIHFHAFSLNGYAHAITHGDWWGGKGVGMCRVTHHGINFNLVTTHLHAAYSYKHDKYIHHRVAQAFETAQLLRFCRKSDDVVIFAGDLNCTIQDVPFRLMKHSANMLDTFSEAISKPLHATGTTNECPANSYTTAMALKEDPDGKRIDYIMYKSCSTFKVTTKLCDQPWPSRIPSQSFSFSDHEPVRAVLHITPLTKHQMNVEEKEDVKAQTDALLDSAAVCNQGLNQVCSDFYFYSIFSILLGVMLLVLLILIAINIPGAAKAAVGFFIIILTPVLAYISFMATVGNSVEYNAIQATRFAIDKLLEQIRTQNARIFEEERKKSLSPVK